MPRWPRGPIWIASMIASMLAATLVPALSVAETYGPFAFSPALPYSCDELHVVFSAEVSNVLVTRNDPGPECLASPTSVADSVVITWPYNCVTAAADTVAFTIESSAKALSITRIAWWCGPVTYTYCFSNDLGTNALGLQVTIQGTFSSVVVNEQPAACGPPNIVWSEHTATITWPTPCVAPGEQVCLSFGGSSDVVLGNYWLVGVPIAGTWNRAAIALLLLIAGSLALAALVPTNASRSAASRPG